MVKNYVLPLLKFLLVWTVCCSPFMGQSQEIRLFTKADFDLTGTVKSCLVITKYGKEVYDFNKEGLLTKSMTQYNDLDYNVTYYKYGEGELIEKRFENYRNGVFDGSTSYANFYTIDTLPVRKVTEKIITYEREFLDRYEYLYNADGVLVKIIRTNNDGNDETLIEYTDYKGEQTQTNSLNGTVLKSVRKSTKIAKDKSEQQVVLTKKFIEGEPNLAMEEIFDVKGNLISETEFEYDHKEGEFTPKKVVAHEYNQDNILIKSETKSGKSVATKEYIYQFDNGETGNWIKQIITPENSYTTRRITYYKEESTDVVPQEQ